MTTNLICPNCKGRYTDYSFDFGFYCCHECGRSWGGCLDGKDFSKAWVELNWLRLSGTDEEIARAFRIAFDNLEAIAKALENNPTLKLEPKVLYVTKLPSDSKWWIENRRNIENKLLAIEAPQNLLR